LKIKKYKPTGMIEAVAGRAYCAGERLEDLFLLQQQYN